MRLSVCYRRVLVLEAHRIVFLTCISTKYSLVATNHSEALAGKNYLKEYIGIAIIPLVSSLLATMIMMLLP